MYLIFCFVFPDNMDRQRAESTFTIISKVKNSPRVDTIIEWLKNNKFLILILVAVIFGVTLGKETFIKLYFSRIIFSLLSIS